jgi:hypothetical protein
MYKYGCEFSLLSVKIEAGSFRKKSYRNLGVFWKLL